MMLRAVSPAGRFAWSRKAAGAVILCSVLCLLPREARAWRVFITSRGAEVHWAGEAAPVVLAPGWPLAGGDGAVAEAAESALGPWNDSGCGVPSRTSLGIDARASLDEADGLTSLVWIDRAAAWNARFGSTELARTLVAFRVGSGAIVDTDIAVNLGGHDFTASVSCPEEGFDLTATLTHELGHALGLDHSDVDDATMYPRTEAADCALRDLAADDLAGLCHLYDVPTPPPDAGPEPVPEPRPEAGPEPDAAEAGDGTGSPDAVAETSRPPPSVGYGCGAGAAAVFPWCVPLLLGFMWVRRVVGRVPRTSPSSAVVCPKSTRSP